MAVRIVNFQVALVTSSSFILTFNQLSLNSTNHLRAAHNLGTIPSAIQVWDSTGLALAPDSVRIVDLNTIDIELTSFCPLQGTYQLSIG